MRKSTIFISAALTTFALVIMYGVVYAYRGLVATNSAGSTEIASTSTEAPSATLEVATLQAVTPEQAAQLAAQVLGRSDLLSAESATINGVNAYKVLFQSGDIAYVGLDGQILSIQTIPQVVMVPAQPVVRRNSNNDGNNNPGDNGGAPQQEHHEQEQEQEHEHEGGD